MTIRNDITINWNVSPRVIEVAAPSVDLTVQDLYDTLRSKAASEGIDEPEITDGSGKEVLSATESVGLTVKLLNAKVKFEDRTEPTDCDIHGGNLVALDENGQPMNPIKYAPYVTVTYAKSSSATMVQDSDIDAIKAKTDNLPSDPANESSIQDLIDTIGEPTSPTIADDLDVIEGQTENLPIDPADQSLIEARITAATQVLEAISQSIKNKTDGIPPDPAIQSLIENRIAEGFSEIKGTPWTDETLKLIKKKIDELQLQPSPSRARVKL